VAAAESSDDHVAQAVAGALGQRKDEGGRATLEKLLDHASSHVRYTTVLSIIELGAKPSRAALAKRKKIEKDAEVRGALRKAGV
jgi:HEAT repeat protein